jgi:hypothetical protein
MYCCVVSKGALTYSCNEASPASVLKNLAKSATWDVRMHFTYQIVPPSIHAKCRSARVGRYRHSCGSDLQNFCPSAAHLWAPQRIFLMSRNIMRTKHRVFLLVWIVCWNGMYGLEAAALERTENSAASPSDNGIVVRAMQYCQGWMFGARRDEMPLGMSHGSSPNVRVSSSEVRVSSLRHSRATSA